MVLTMLPFCNHVFTPPIPLAYLKGYLQQDKDVEVKLLDLEVYYYRSSLISCDPQLYWNRIWEGISSISKEDKLVLDNMVKQILAQRPDVVGFSVTHTNYLFTRYVSQQIRRVTPEIYIIYGGRRFCLRKKWRYHIAGWHRNLPDVDCIVKNEGEATLREIIAILKIGRHPAYCKGATVRFNGQIVDGGDRPLIDDVDSIPFPDFSDLTKQDYLSDYIRILLNRGCSGRCSFCVENDTMGDIVRYRSAQNIVDEIKFRMRQGYRRFQSCDLCLNSNVSHLEKVCRSIITERLGVEFVFGEFKHSPYLTKEIFRLLRKTGFKTAVFGTESGSQLILNKMRKGITVQTIERNIRDAHESGLEVILFLMVGFPGETEGTFAETVDLLRRNKNHIDAVAGTTPTNICWGSDIHDNLKDYDVNIETLFKNPDRWESNDGSNYYEWRVDLSRRMQYCIKELGIGLAGYRKDGNPRVPELALRLCKPIVKSEQEPSGGQYANVPGNNRGYSADLRVCDTPHTKYAKFLLKITNNGKREWKKKGSDWIRVGCRVFNEGNSNDSPALELRQDLPKDTIAKGETFYSMFLIEKGWLARGRYQVRFDMVNEHKFWFEDLGFLPVVEYVESC